MAGKNNLKKIRYFVPIPLLLAATISYIFHATLNIPSLNDYIREINQFIGEGKISSYVCSSAFILQPPAKLLSVWINLHFFGYSVYFDLILGAFGLSLIAFFMYKYVLDFKVNLYFYAAVLICIFSLNKWEMILNGTGWPHFWAFAMFYLYFYLLDLWYTKKEISGKRQIFLIVLAPVTILCIAVFYSAVFAVTLNLFYFGMILAKYKRAEKIDNEIIFLLSVDIPLAIYVLCSYLQRDNRVISDGSLFAALLEEPVFFIKFFVASFSAEMIGVETVTSTANGMIWAYVLGIFVIGMYMVSAYLILSLHIYKKTILPVCLLVSGFLNHVIILCSRWGFRSVTYGMSSRYGLQYMEGVLGIIVTLAYAYQICSRRIIRRYMLLITALFVGGNLLTTYDELHKMPYRLYASEQAKTVFFSYDDYDNKELGQMFVTDGKSVRDAMEILKIYQLSIWKNYQ